MVKLEVGPVLFSAHFGKQTGRTTGSLGPLELGVANFTVGLEKMGGGMPRLLERKDERPEWKASHDWMDG